MVIEHFKMDLNSFRSYSKGGAKMNRFAIIEVAYWQHLSCCRDDHSSLVQLELRTQESEIAFEDYRWAQRKREAVLYGGMQKNTKVRSNMLQQVIPNCIHHTIETFVEILLSIRLSVSPWWVKWV